jgi:hypothetical protein
MFYIDFDNEFHSSFERVFRENRRFASSQAVASVYSSVHVKSILGVGPKVKESIKTLLGGRSGLEAFVLSYTSELNV